MTKYLFYLSFSTYCPLKQMGKKPAFLTVKTCLDGSAEVEFRKVVLTPITKLAE